jgi:carbonic anhydrase
MLCRLPASESAFPKEEITPVRKVLSRLYTAAASQPENSDRARSVLLQGNRDFAKANEAWANGKRADNPHSARGASVGGPNGTAPAQTPFAAILGCADARVPPEIVFNTGSNEIFVVRVAGNVLGQDCLGSLRYAANNFSATLKLLVVLAHANCGAVSEAVDVYLQPSKYLDIATDYSVRCIEDQVLLSVRVAAMSLESLHGSKAMKRRGYRSALLEVAVVLNAAWSAYCLRKEFQNRFPDLGVVFGAYDLLSGHLRLPLSPPGKITEEEKGLFLPPQDASGFRQLALRICQGEFIQSLMAGSHRRSA